MIAFLLMMNPPVFSLPFTYPYWSTELNRMVSCLKCVPLFTLHIISDISVSRIQCRDLFTTGKNLQSKQWHGMTLKDFRCNPWLSSYWWINQLVLSLWYGAKPCRKLSFNRIVQLVYSLRTCWLLYQYSNNR